MAVPPSYCRDRADWLGAIVTFESRIHELCRRAVTAKDDEVELVLAELRVALREHILHTRRLLSTYPFSRRSRETCGTLVAQRLTARKKETSGLPQFTTPSDAVWDTLQRI